MEFGSKMNYAERCRAVLVILDKYRGHSNGAINKSPYKYSWVIPSPARGMSNTYSFNNKNILAASHVCLSVTGQFYTWPNGEMGSWKEEYGRVDRGLWG